MKNVKKLILLVLALSMIVALAGCALFGTNYIGKAAAKDAALTAAGLAAADVTKLKASFEKEEGYAYYEVDFIYDAVEYDYSIDALTGEVKNVTSESVFD